ncbi:dolichol-phosphate mannosyltransferase subunit 3 [Periplaneta americana]|uniref:dolichol-phosphate mannosyltransferase subunit 3 n=1 Tax=Periplaneta americana TaxID=6978 RepID=UPI0037E88E59
MTKLLEWLLGLGVFVGVWGVLISRQIRSRVVDEWMSVIIPLPIIIILMFGVYSAIVVLWRVYNFNNCEEAAKELQKEIQQAKRELRSKGIVFSEDE